MQECFLLSLPRHPSLKFSTSHLSKRGRDGAGEKGEGRQQSSLVSRCLIASGNTSAEKKQRQTESESGTGTDEDDEE